MQSSISVKLILILAAVVLSLYLLYPTYQLSVMSSDEKDRLEVENKKSITEFANTCQEPGITDASDKVKLYIGNGTSIEIAIIAFASAPPKINLN